MSQPPQMPRSCQWAAIVVVAFAAAPLMASATSPAGTPQLGAQRTQTLTIPYLGNASRPDDLDFAAATCEISAAGEQMHCTFRQVFLTPTSIDPSSCAITTNGYERTFRHESNARWVSSSAPEGACGIVETTTLEDGGGTRWTMTVRAETTIGGTREECRTAIPPTEVYDWRRMKRTLPCTSIQPGAIER